MNDPSGVQANEMDSNGAELTEPSGAPEGKPKKVKEAEKGRRHLTGPYGIIVTVVAVLGVLYQLYNVEFGIIPAIQLRSFHWAYLSLLAFLCYPAFRWSNKKRPSVLDCILAVVAFGVAIYVSFTWRAVAARLGIATDLEVILAVIAIFVVLELVRRVVGLPLMIVTAVFIAYAFLGPHMPGALVHRGASLGLFARVMYISTDGIFGIPLGISANYVLLFIVFGAFLKESGGGQLFTDIAFALVGKSVGGPAKACVVSSALFGMISGAAVANVVTTGNFTIPLMRKTGYDKETAGAIEAVASTGGQVVPPVLGASAFMMAEILGIPYATIAVAAIAAAVLFFVFLFINVHIEAEKAGLSGLSADALPKIGEALKSRGHLLIPLLVLIGVIVSGYSPGRAIFWSIVLVVAVSWLRKGTRMYPMAVIRALRDGAINTLPVVVACAAAGIITGVLSLTGVGLRFSSILISFSGGYMFSMLILAMIAALILGMGLPTSAAYIILAVLTAPAMISVGVPPLAAHYFLFFFGCLSTITPPVGLSAYAAAGIAQSNPIKTGLIALKLGLVGYVIPFLAVYRPGLLLLDTPLSNAAAIVFALVATVLLTYGVQGWRCNRRLRIVPRLAFIGLAIVVFLPVPYIVDFIAAGLGIALLVITGRKRPQLPPATA